MADLNIFDCELRQEVLKVTGMLDDTVHTFTFFSLGPLDGARGQDPNAIWSFFKSQLLTLAILAF